jgi:hypothetical protein
MWDNRCSQHNPVNDYHGFRRSCIASRWRETSRDDPRRADSAACPGRLQIRQFPGDEAGVSKAQSDRDIQQCEDRARTFTRGRTATGRDQVQAYNRLVIDCLRDRGYSMSGE